MVVVDSLNRQDLNRAGDDLNRLVHELARIGENHGLAWSTGLCVGELDDYSLKIRNTASDTFNMCKSGFRDKKGLIFVTKLGFAHIESVTRGINLFSLPC